MKIPVSRNGRQPFRPLFWAGLCALLFFPAETPVMAQSITGVGADNRLEPSVLQPRGLPTPPEQAQPLKPTESKSQPEVDAQGVSGEDTDETEEQSPHFVLREIQISGVTVFPAKVLEEKFTPWIDREIGYKELLLIAANITKLYKENGYITSRAVLPPQEIENGIVIIQVAEGKVGDIKIEGNRYVPDAYIAERIHQKPGDIFRLQTLQKDMLSLSEDYLLNKAHATLKTGERPGSSDLVLDIMDHRPIHLMVGTDNGGRNGIGLWRTSYTLTDENVSGVGDSALLNASISTQTVAAFGQYRYPLTTNGWGVGGNYSFTHVRAGETPNPVLMDGVSDYRSITGKSHRVSLFTDFPIYRSLLNRRWNVAGNLSLNFIDSMTYLDGESLKDVEYELKKVNPLNTVEHFPILRTVSGQVQALEQDRTGRWMLGAGMTGGIVALGGNDAYTKFNASVTRVQALPYGLIGFFRGETQLTPNRLPFAEKMQIGGANSVRGYSEGLLIADSGYLLSAELRYPMSFLPKKIRNDWQGLVFADYGQVFACGSIDEGTPAGNTGTLLGYGIGFRGRVTRYLDARLDLGVASGHKQNQPDFRAHFSLSSTLF
ncbi:MAG TPA: ShlB/FhaC/HecB family hemolysin secretion/activation protein [Coleofasciculaceae cyanobacterium]|jgi:hemolysin activation/secretion protein